MQTLSGKQEMQIISLKWLLFPYWLSDFFFEINRIQAVDYINKLCYFHKNLTTDADFIG